jgi:hypothetical protein
VSETGPDQRSLPTDIALLRRLSFTSSRPELTDSKRAALVERALAHWPDRASPVLRLAAHAHGLAKHLRDRLAYTAAHLAELVAREPEALEPPDADCILLAALVRAEQFDYSSFESDRGTAMVLRDALTDPEDVATVDAEVRWYALMGLRVRTPDDLLRSWARDAAALPEDADINEYDDTLDIRSHLQRLSASLSWAGQAQWREHIEPADEAFRRATERVDIPLVLGPRAEPAEWWRYRVPLGAPDLYRSQVAGTINPERYAPAPDTRGKHGGLRTISDVWRLAERRGGLSAMTEAELRYWASFIGAQAKAEAERGHLTDWQQRQSAVAEEWRRRLRELGPEPT